MFHRAPLFLSAPRRQALWHALTPFAFLLTVNTAAAAVTVALDGPPAIAGSCDSPIAQPNISNGLSTGDITLRIGSSDSTTIRTLDQIQPFPDPDHTPANDLRVAYRASTSCPTWPVLRIGPITAQQIVIPARTFPVSAPSGVSYVPFVAAQLSGKWYSLTPQRQWQAFTSCQDVTAALAPQSSPMPAIPLLPAATDLSALRGLDLWSGWGQASSGTTTEQACQSMQQDQGLSHLLTLP